MSMTTPLMMTVYPRKVYAISSYREQFQRLNEKDNALVIEKYKEDLIRTFGHSKVISNLDRNLIDELHYIQVMYNKPLSPEQKIYLRKKFLPYLENQNKEQQKFFEYIAKYYELF